VILSSKSRWLVLPPVDGVSLITNGKVLGHESSGVVSKGTSHVCVLFIPSLITSEQVGAKVKTHKVGDRVAMEPGATCLVCEACRSGRYQVCAGVQKSMKHIRQYVVRSYAPT
jgi:Alcohol dehydrogenase GroES-like domain